MNVDSIQNGYVIDHIQAGRGMEIYRVLSLEELDCCVAVLRNVPSGRSGRKDIIKIDELIPLDIDVIGYIDPGITVNVVKDCVIVDKKKLQLPETVTGVIHCNNPRCITSIEQELPQKFRLADSGDGIYRCVYCETKAKRA